MRTNSAKFHQNPMKWWKDGIRVGHGAGIGKNFKSKTKSVLDILPISCEGGRTSSCSGSGCSIGVVLMG